MAFKDVLRIQREYFVECSNEIAVRNLKLLKSVCYLGITIYVIYFWVTFLFFKSKMISPVFAIIVPIMIGCILRINDLQKNYELTFKRSKSITVIMYIVLMLFIIAMSVYAQPELNTVYYPLFLMLVPVMFILPIYYLVGINLMSFPLYVIAECTTKQQALWSHDIFLSVTGLILSFVMIILMTQFRVQTENLKNEYYYLSRQDGLTGLYNKMTGLDLADSFISTLETKGCYTVVLVDVDDFKLINDTYGHEKGDEVLARIGHKLTNYFRKDDIISRYGGDEFMIMMKNTNETDAIKKISKVIDLICLDEILQEVKGTCSMGLYTGRGNIINIHESIKKADVALYEAKKTNKGGFQAYKE